jgi:rhodanese-related sulfurtransferase
MLTSNSEQRGKRYEIDAFTLSQWRQQPTVLLWDVREPAEYAREHIPGATLMPLSRFESSQLTQYQDNRIILYCQSGNRSTQALQKLRTAGFQDVFQLPGGLPTWKQAGYDTKENKKAPISLMRQVQIVAGFLVLTGTLLGAFVSPWFLILSGFVGGGLMMAGMTNTCLMARLLAKLPYNQQEVK